MTRPDSPERSTGHPGPERVRPDPMYGSREVSRLCHVRAAEPPTSSHPTHVRVHMDTGTTHTDVQIDWFGPTDPSTVNTLTRS